MEVEIPPPSPFACAAVHNRRTPFHNNLDKLDITDLWVHTPQWQASGSASTTNKNARNITYPSSDGEATAATSTAAEPIKRNSYASDSEATLEANKPRDRWARAREIVFPNNTTPPKHPVDVSNAGGVSSLVQKWKGFEAGAKRPPPPPPPPSAAAVVNDDDSVIGDWESDRTVVSGRSSVRGRDSDAAESERLRVVDIIKKLTPNEIGSDSPPRRISLDHAELRCLPPVPLPRLRTSLDHSDLRYLSTVGSSPRVRGRQAYLDLLVQAEKERRAELQTLLTRKPVSTFSHRGRIQAALKIKLLRRGMQPKEAQPHFRERVNSKAQNAPIHSGSQSKEKIRNLKSVDEEKQKGSETWVKDHHLKDSQHTPTTSKQQDTNLTSLDSNTDNNDFFQAIEEFHQAQTSFPVQENNWESSTTKSPEKEAPQPEESRAANYQGNHDIIEATTPYWACNASHTEEGWEEFHYDDDQPNEEANNNTDWIEMVSRPRNDWEYLRRERYQEMLDPFLDNEDIRVLLNRKSVSSFLSSNMRDKIDQLMISRTQGNTTVNNNIRQEKRQEQVGEKVQIGGRDEEYFQEYEEAESSQHFTECDDFTDSTSASWSHNQNQNQGGHEPSESSYQATSPSTRHRDEKGRNSSFNANSSIEMDLIYDLRREMEQLHQEMSELRKSIQCSTDMQIKLHRSIKKELNHHLDTKSGRRHMARKGNGRRCCVCSKVQVDCVLYKCGHMCTCFVCAHDLQWNNGNCPICRAQIVDVIRTQTNW